MHLLQDTHDIGHDQLGFSPIADSLYIAIKDTLPPFTIGIFGEWGCGKTTLMRMIKQRIDINGGKTVWFNAWKYSGKEIIWNALIQEIFYTMNCDEEIDHIENFKELLKTTSIELARYAAKVTTRFIPGSFITEDDIDQIGSIFSSLNIESKQFEFVNKFELIFDDLVKKYVGEHGKLVIFIDDLDRCLPENSIEILEAIKLYLDRSNCIFILAAEQSIIEEGIRDKYKGNDRISAKKYLEKIVQLPFSMRGIEEHNALALLEPYENTINYRNDQLMRRLIIEGTRCNPRRIKRFLNSIYVLSNMNKIWEGDKLRCLAKILLIQMTFPELYKELLSDLDLVAFLTDLFVATGEKRERMLSSSSNIVQKLYHDYELRRFLENTSEIECDKKNIEPWVLLTQGVTVSL